MDFNLIESRIVIDSVPPHRRRPGRTSRGLAAAAAAWCVALAALAVSVVARDARGVSPAGPRADRDAGLPADSAVRVRRRVYAMGTVLTATAWADRRRTAVEALEDAVRSVEAMEERLSTWRDDTEMAALNAAPAGRPVPVGDTLFRLLREARRWVRATGGAFDPAVGSLVEAWDLRGEGRVPEADRLRAARSAAGMDCWTLDAGGRTVTRRCEAGWIDAGAFGKGAALRAAGDALRRSGAGAALLDFGGQLLAVGRPPDASGREVGVAHPSRRERPVATLELADASVATTSASERFVEVAGETRGHVLDPRSGEPVPPWGSVTVAAEDPVAADALSTALFVLGPGEALAWARSRDDVGVLVLEETDDGLEAGWNRAMERHLPADARSRLRSPARADAGGAARPDTPGPRER